MSDAGGTPAKNIAILGDVHGGFHHAIRLLRQAERRFGIGIDLVLQVGDLEPHRDEADVATMSAPSRYRELGDFYEFHRGAARFPWPMWFIGGNHEPWPFLDGVGAGEVAPGVRFIGRAGVVEVCGLRIAGLSGIYREELYGLKRSEMPGRPKGWIGFCAEEVERLAAEERPDVLLLHEWPAGVLREEDRAWMAGELDGETKRRGGEVGNEMGRLLVEMLKPGLVGCGHMHLPYRGQIGESAICCVANVGAATAALGIFRWEGGVFTEL